MSLFFGTYNEMMMIQLVRYEREGWQYPAGAASATSDCAALGHQYWAFSTTILRANTSPPKYCASSMKCLSTTIHVHHW